MSWRLYPEGATDVSLPDEVREHVERAVAAERASTEQRYREQGAQLEQCLRQQEHLRRSTARILSGRDDWFDYEGGQVDATKAITEWLDEHGHPDVAMEVRVQFLWRFDTDDEASPACAPVETAQSPGASPASTLERDDAARTSR